MGNNIEEIFEQMSDHYKIINIINNMYDISVVIKFKNEAISNMKYEIAALLRNREKYLMSDDGKIAICKEKIRVKVESREDKLYRIIIKPLK